MGYLRSRTVLSTSALLTCLALAAASPAAATGNDPSHGATYIITNTDAGTGKFTSRSLITFGADHTVSVVDSAQNGPAFYFSSQLGSWSTTGRGMGTARTLDFDFPPQPGMARLDWTFRATSSGTISGKVELYSFSLEANPTEGGTLAGTFNFTGYVVSP